MRTDDLLGLVFPQANACLENVVGDIELPDHPLVFETMRDCLVEFLDAEGLVALIARIERGEVELIARDTVEPSPLSHEILNANPYAYLDDAPLEERRTRAVTLPRRLRAEIEPELGGAGRVIDDAAIAAAERAAEPDVRSSDELHDHMLSLWALAPEERWQPWFDQLVARGRAAVVNGLWVAAERAEAVRAGDDAAVLEMVGAYLAYSGPRAAAELAAHFGLPVDRVDTALLALEAEGGVLRGDFTGKGLQFCDRRMLARIHRLAIGRLRREIEPVSPAAMMRFFFRWQRVARGSQAIGADGLARVIEQLQGFESAAGAWEKEILPARLHGYEPEWLDMLCLSGEVAWARLSPRTATSGKAAPTRAAPLALLRRADLSWLRASSPVAAADEIDLGEAARAVHHHLAGSGASFLVDLVSALGRPPAEIEDALWELVAAGLATADGFASLRVLTDRRRGESRSLFDRSDSSAISPRSRITAVKKARARDRERPAHALRALPTSAGRWSLLRPPDPAAADPDRAARQLLARYGIVFRDLLARESCLPPWRDLLRALRRLEARGEIRGGRFVSGFVGEQFALPEAVEGLRAERAARAYPPEVVRIAAADPLNLVGVTSPGARVPAVIGNAVLYRNGIPLASLEGGQLVLRDRLEGGEAVDPDLAYHPPVRVDLREYQTALPL
jgi:ATP-dependent Lhr-like helicase